MNYKLMHWINKLKLKSWLTNILLVVVVVSIVSWVQTLNMLSTGEKLEQTQFSMLNYQTNQTEVFDFSAQDKETLVYFFAPWCGVCHLSIDNLEAVYQDKPNSKIIAIALDYQTQAEVAEFVNQHQLSFPVYFGNHQLKQNFKVSAYPSYYVISAAGEVSSKVAGYSTEIGMKLRL